MQEQKHKNNKKQVPDGTTVQLTNFKEARSRYTSAMSATHNNLVTDDNSARAARTIVALLAEAQGSSANSLAATRIESPEGKDRLKSSKSGRKYTLYKYTLFFYCRTKCIDIFYTCACICCS